MSKKSRQTKQGRRIFHPEHRMNRTSLEAYRKAATKAAHLSIRGQVLALLSNFPEESFSRLKLVRITGIRESTLCSVLNSLKNCNLINVEVKVDAETESPNNVEHYLHKKRKESQQATLF